MTFHLALGEKEEGLRFPDITKMGPPDRNYSEVMGQYRYSSDKMPFSQVQLRQLEARSMFWDDLSMDALCETFLKPKERNFGYDETLEGRGGRLVLNALRRFTTDVDTINYCLDVQDDFENPQLGRAFNHFYNQVMRARQTYELGFQHNYDGKRIADGHGRFLYQDCTKFPAAFDILEQAICGLRNLLKTTSSQGMRDVDLFFGQVTQSEEYQRWLTNRVVLAGEKTVGFIVKYGADGEPLKALMIGDPKNEGGIEKLLELAPDRCGKVNIDAHPEIVAQRARLVLKREMGYIIESLYDLSFMTLEPFLNQLVRGMEEQLAFYITLSKLYAAFESLGIQMVRPQFYDAKERRAEIKGAVHPVVVKDCIDKGRKIVPNDFKHDPDHNILLVAGPNDGGKSCYSKTIGLIYVMAQARLRVPAQYAKISPVSDIYTHFVSSDDLKAGKGRHRNELSRERKLAEFVTPTDLVLADEPCGGTSNTQGIEDSRDLIDYIHSIGVPMIFVTHLHELANFVDSGRWSAVQNFQAEIIENKDGGELTYRIIPGRSKGSYGSRISREEKVTREDLARLLHERIKEGHLDASAIRSQTLP